MKRLAILLMASAVALSACQGGNAPEAESAGTEIGVDLAGLNRNVKPGDDFDEFANGGWRNATEIPADRTNLGSFVSIAMEVEKRNEQLVAELAKSNPAAGSDERRIADFHRAFSNTTAIEQAGLRPLAPHFARIDTVADTRGLSQALGATVRADTDPLNATNFWTENLFGAFFAQALQDPNRNAAHLLQGGLGMPDRSYYLSQEGSMSDLRGQYRQYLAGLASALG